MLVQNRKSECRASNFEIHFAQIVKDPTKYEINSVHKKPQNKSLLPSP